MGCRVGDLRHFQIVLQGPTLCSQQQFRSDLASLHFPVTFGVVTAFYFNHSNRHREISHCILICISLKAHDSEH